MKGLIICLISLSFLCGASGIFAQKKPIAKKPKPKPVKTQPTTTTAANSLWQKDFVSAEGRFKIMFPTDPTMKVTDDGEGELRLRSVSHRAFGGTTGYAVTVTESFSDAQGNPERELKGLVSLLATKGTVLRETKLNMDGIGGWEIIYQKADQSIAQHRIYLLGNRQYETIAVYGAMAGEKPETAIERNKPEVSKFLDSFKIFK